MESYGSVHTALRKQCIISNDHPFGCPIIYTDNFFTMLFCPLIPPTMYNTSHLIRTPYLRRLCFTPVCLSTGGVCLSACWDTPPPPGEDPLGSRHPQEQTPPWSRPPPNHTATAADGTHPTGMHPSNLPG